MSMQEVAEVDNPLSEIGAWDYVNSVMADIHPLPVSVGCGNGHVNIGEEGLTCTPSRKRQLSNNDHDVYDLDRDSSCGLMHIAKKQRGSVYNHENDDNGVHVDNMTIYNMFESLSKQVENLYTNFNKRISSIEENLELKLTQKLKNAVDNTVQSEVSVVAQEVKDHVAECGIKSRMLRKSFK